MILPEPTEREILVRTKLIQDLLTPAVLARLRSFAAELASTKADIYVFVARKAVCMMDVFASLGWPLPGGIWLSDRALDSLRSMRFAAATSVIVDDIVVLGSTISRVDRALRELGLQTDSRVVAVNRQWHSPDLYKVSGVELQLSDSESAIFCSSLVDAIIACGRPYEVDFPLIRLQSADPVFQASRWLIEGCTAEDRSRDLHLRCDQRRMVVHISQDHAREILSRAVCPALNRTLSLTKLRLYTDLVGSRGTVMPIVSFGELSASTLQEAIDALVRSLDKGTGAQLRESVHARPSLAHRLLVYVSSFALANAALSHATRPGYHRSFLGDIADRDIEIALGPALAQPTRSLLQRIERLAVWGTAPTPLSAARSPKAPRSHSTVGHGVIAEIKGELEATPSDSTLEHALGKYFLAMHNSIEIPGRQAIRSHARSPESDRLSRGLTLNDLMLLLGEDGWAVDDPVIAREVSVLLDDLVDRGVAVPATWVDDSGDTFRVYRPGEDVHFLDKHLKLLCDALSRAYAEVARLKVPRLSRIQIEKLLVLLIKYMWGMNIASPATERTAGHRVRVGYMTMGAVAEISEPRRRAQLLYTHLENLRAVDQSGVNSNVVAGLFRDDPPVDPIQQALLNSFARNWVRAMARSEGSGDVEAIVLASCSNDTDVMQALFADLDVCVNSVSDCLGSPSLSGESSTHSDRLHRVRVLGDAFRGEALSAINQFHLKLSAHESRRFENLLSIASERLRDHFDEENAEAWAAAWSRISPAGVKRRDDARSLIADLKKFGVLMGFVVRLADAAASFAADMTRPRGEPVCPADLLEPSLVRQVESVMDELQMRNSIPEIINGVQLLRDTGNDAHRTQVGLSLMRSIAALFGEVSIFWRSESQLIEQLMSRIVGETYAGAQRPFAARSVVWYDVKDSRARRSDDVLSLRRAVANFKSGVNSHIDNLIAGMSGRMAAYHGDLRSTDDEKYLFLEDGADAEKLLNGVLRVARLEAPVTLRLVVCECSAIDSDLAVALVDDHGNAHANGGFFEWFAEVTSRMKAREAEEPFDGHRIYYVRDAARRESHREFAPRLPSREISVEAQIGMQKRQFHLTEYRLERDATLAFGRVRQEGTQPSPSA